MMDFDMEDDTSSAGGGTGVPGGVPGGSQGGVGGPPPFVTRPPITEELKKQIIKEVTVDLISPKELSNQHNIPVEKIRKLIKDAGHKLPNRYKVTSSKSQSG